MRNFINKNKYLVFHAKSKYLFLLISIVLSPIVHGQLIISELPNDNQEDLQSFVGNLISTNSNIAVSNISLTGDVRCLGSFTGGAGLGEGVLGFDSGLILGSGRAIDAVGPNSSDEMTGEFFTPGDDFLNALVLEQTVDACVLEFDFECQDSSMISLDYVMGSEEYNEFIDPEFSDVFAFVLNGENISTIPDSGGLPVSIRYLNCGNPYDPSSPVSPDIPFCDLFINNDIQDGGGAINIQADGLTTVLTAKGDLLGGTNHMKFAIADTLDQAFDSWVFLRSNSFECPQDIPPPTPTPGPLPNLLISTKNKAFFNEEHFKDEDIIQLNSDGSSTRYFDGSDVGLADTGVDVVYVSPSGDLFLSVSHMVEHPDVGLIKNEDIIRFKPTSLGASTRGTLSIYFNGSKEGLIDSDIDQNIDALYLDEGSVSDPLNDDDNDGILNVGDICPLDSLNDADNDGICGNTLIYFSLSSSIKLQGVRYSDEDIIVYSEATGAYSKFFDGSDVGVEHNDVDAFRLLEDGSLLLSFKSYMTLPSPGTIADHDIVRFVPTSLGVNTSGSFEIYLDGYASGIQELYAEEDFDFEAVDVLVPTQPEPIMLTSFKNKALYGSEYFYNEDIVQHNKDGSSTRFFDGSDVGLSNTGLDGVYLSQTGVLYLSVTNMLELPGIGLVKNEDIIRFTPTSLGVSTQGSFTKVFDGSAHGLLDGEIDQNIDAIFIDEGNVSGPLNDDDNDGILNQNDLCPLDAQNDADNDGLCGNVKLYFSLSAPASLNGINLYPEDVILFNESTGSFSKFFDGSDVGLAGNDVDSFSIMPDGRLLLSFSAHITLPDVGTIGDYQVARFTPTSLGASTRGSFEVFFDSLSRGVEEYIAEEDYDTGAVSLYFPP